ncbi:hypothetical protein M8C21_026976 [Ambrosia artemisiifolia]|uniref:P-type ATPase C-terminal domain-containing protein n=1 Tax=Ambrosia artemisiifolia TaxID=4212 RepID=A0AAD5GTB0_AMBAR|nr:hypothetical protein M8C21_026976 [Ambrosia artemisiifolia]
MSYVLVNDRFEQKRWKDIQVGEVVKVLADETIPCDIVLLSTSDLTGVAYIQTINLDGESNLKTRYAKQETLSRVPEKDIISGLIKCEKPNRNIYGFQGNMEIDGKRVSLGPSNIILRGCVIKNTDWAVGVAVYAGRETKAMLNNSGAPSKRSRLETHMNQEIMLLSFFLVTLCVVVSACAGVWLKRHQDELDMMQFYRRKDYSEGEEENYNYYGLGLEIFFSFLMSVIVFQIMIPISLYISMELVRVGQAYFMIHDDKMFDAASNTRFQCRALNINEDLGQINKDIYDFFLALAACNTIVPIVVNTSNPNEKLIDYQGESPDEQALVYAAAAYGFMLIERTSGHIVIDIQGERQRFNVLGMHEFDSDRKRMSVILGYPDGTVKVFVKGADTTMFKVIDESLNLDVVRATETHLHSYSSIGLRTLVVGMRALSVSEFDTWQTSYEIASTALMGRAGLLRKVAIKLENNLSLLGASAIEDKLQQGVPEAIESLRKADIKLFELASKCAVVLCCRVAPLQKAGIVALIKKRTDDMTLAIGDGANDVSMIQMADVGVGISGQEGRQAVMSSDFAMGQFRFLVPLLLVHGHWNYQRMAYMILYNFYRNALFVLVLYVLYTGFTLTTAITEWSSVLYSIIYTAIPTIVIGILDKDLSRKSLMTYPQLYGAGQRKESYNLKLFWVTMVDTLWQSVVAFFIPVYAYWKSDIDSSSLGDLWTLAVVFMVNIHLAMDVIRWTWISHASIWGSIIATCICVIVIDAIPVLPGAIFNLASSGLFWICVLGIPIISMIPRFVVKMFMQHCKPSDIQIAREAEKFRNSMEITRSGEIELNR